MPPDGHRSEGTLSFSEVPYAGAKPFGSFLAFEKGTRCKSEPASSHTAETDMYTEQGNLVGPQAAKSKAPVKTLNTHPEISRAIETTPHLPHLRPILHCAGAP